MLLWLAKDLCDSLGTPFWGAVAAWLVDVVTDVGLVSKRRLTYAPHMVSESLREYSCTVNAEVADVNTRPRLLRTPGLPVPDGAAVEITTGSELMVRAAVRHQGEVMGARAPQFRSINPAVLDLSSNVLLPEYSAWTPKSMLLARALARLVYQNQRLVLLILGSATSLFLLFVAPGLAITGVLTSVLCLVTVRFRSIAGTLIHSVGACANACFETCRRLLLDSTLGLASLSRRGWRATSALWK